MRTLVLAAAGLALSLSACSLESDSWGPAPVSTTAGTSSVTAAPVETEAAPVETEAASVDYPADTKKVCAKVHTLVSSKKKNGELYRLVQPLITMATYRGVGRTREADRYRAPARKSLHRFAAAVRRDAGRAKDPDLRATVRQTTEDIDALAESNAFFSSLTSLDTWGPQMEPFFDAFMPVTNYCRDAGAPF